MVKCGSSKQPQKLWPRKHGVISIDLKAQYILQIIGPENHDKDGLLRA